MESDRQRKSAEIVHSEEETKFNGKRSVGRPPKSRVIESSSGSEKHVATLGLRNKKTDDETLNDVITIEDTHH